MLFQNYLAKNLRFAFAKACSVHILLSQEKIALADFCTHGLLKITGNIVFSGLKTYRLGIS